MDPALILLLIAIFVIIVIYIKHRKYNVVYIRSEVDGNYYLVRDLEDKQQASNLLAKIRQNIMELTDHLYANKDGAYIAYRPYIIQLHNKIRDVVVVESSEDNVYTSYSINKGEQIVFCLRSREVKNKIHQLNLLMYVVLHEISHVACPEYNHTPLFKRIFAFITQVAIDIGMYKRINFSVHPEEYCGLEITDSII